MKKYLASILVSCGSSVPRSANLGLFRFGILSAIALAFCGCQSPMQRPAVTAMSDYPSPKIRVAKPQIPPVQDPNRPPYATFSNSVNLVPQTTIPPTSSYYQSSGSTLPNSATPVTPAQPPQTGFTPSPGVSSQSRYAYPASYPPNSSAAKLSQDITPLPNGPAYFPVTTYSPQTMSPNGIVPNATVPFGTVNVLPPQQTADLNIIVPNNSSGRFTIGGTYSSDNRLLGQIIIEERNFDTPRRVREVFDPRSWRGGGKNFRLEASPGQDVQRYLVSLSNPYFGGTASSLSLSGYYFERQFFDFNEDRAGGRISFGRRLSDFVTMDIGVRLESVTIKDPRVNTSTQLNDALGTSNLFLGSVGFVYDTRFNPVESAQGTYLSMHYRQGFGTDTFPRGDIEFRHHRLMYQRPDTSGRHILSYKTKVGFSGANTPIYENYIAGGLSTLRGFKFRGVSPIEGGVRVGGEFQWLNSLEYDFPLTADDMIHGVVFTDFGTVEEKIQLRSENFRVAPGLGLRVHLPFAGMAAPLAFDFAYPVNTATGDEQQTFSFYVGLLR